MKPTLFITGAGGFLGNHLLEKLDYSKYHAVYCLELRRELVQLPDNIPAGTTVKVIEGNLLDPPSYESFLEGVDSVLHLAALTGKADPKVYVKVNAYATMLLLDRCKQAGVKNFLFVSSIAVAFKNKYRYFYAHSKEEAENYVKGSGLNFTILRPTMLMGKGSPVFTGLAQLAGLPVIPMFGRGDIEIQPIHVEDMAKAIARIDSDNRYNGETLELGGPDIITIKEFMKKIPAARGKKVPPVLRLPMGLTVFGLSILERVVYGFLPLTVGQLASFRNDGIAQSNSLAKKLSPMMKGLDEIIKDSLRQDQPPDIPKPLARECRVFCRYLVKQKPTHYVLEKYEQLHKKLDMEPADFHDSLLLKLASRTPLLTRSADAYSRFFRSNSLVRKKLAYLMAVLDVSPPYFRYYDSAGVGGKLGFLVKAGLLGMGLFFHLLFTTPFLLPLQVLAKLTGKKSEAEVSE